MPVGWDSAGWTIAGASGRANVQLLNDFVTSPVLMNGSDLGFHSFADMAAEPNVSLAPHGYLGALSVASSASHIYNVSVVGNASALFAEPIGLSLMHGSILCTALGDVGVDCKPITVALDVMPQSAAEIEYERIYNAILKSTIAGLILSLLIVVAVPSQIAPVLEERVRCMLPVHGNHESEF